MKKFTVIFITLICILSICAVDLSALENEEFSYTVQNEEIMINSYKGYDKNLVIPEEIDGLPVTVVSDYFTSKYIQEFDSITISQNINSFDSGWINVSKVPFENVKTKKYIVDENNASFASYNGALYSKDLTNLKRAPANQSMTSLYPYVETISEGAFIKTDYTKIIIPQSVTSIEENYNYGILGGCDTLQEIVVEQGNQNYYIDNDALYQSADGDKVLIRFPGNKAVDTYLIANGTTKISANAFQGKNIKSVIFPESLTKLNSNAFYECMSLEELVLPDTMDTIEWGAFEFCTNLKTVDMGNNITQVEMNAFYGCTNLETVIISENTDNILMNTFSNCKNLKNVVFPEGVKSIEASAFLFCDSLTDIVIPRSVTYMELNAFDDHVTLHVYEGSYALDYAKENNLRYEVIYDRLIGDLNFDQNVDFNDAIIILQADSGLVQLNEQQLEIADVNGDSIVDYNDAIKILQLDAGID